MIQLNLYIEGLDMTQFTRIDSISNYNNNYYVGFDKDLLFGLSDDDNTTEWFLIKNTEFIYLGDSFTSQNDILHRYTERQL